MEYCEQLKSYNSALSANIASCDTTLRSANKTIIDLKLAVQEKDEVIKSMEDINLAQYKMIENDQRIFKKVKKKATIRTIGWAIGGGGIGFLAGLLTGFMVAK